MRNKFHKQGMLSGIHLLVCGILYILGQYNVIDKVDSIFLMAGSMLVVLLLGNSE